MLLGCINKALPKKSVPIPTNKSEKTNPKKILNNANINNGIITAKLASCIFKYVALDPLGIVKNTSDINLNE